MKIAICCIAYKEDHYIDEWLDYHHKLGFDAIHMYQNKGWLCRTERYYLIKESYAQENSQVRIYNEFIKKYSTKYDWVACIDCDEFIVLKKHMNIHQFLSDYSDSVSLNWQYYGSNGRENRESKSLLRQFIHRQNGVDKHVKTIFKSTSMHNYIDPHCLTVPALDTNRNYFTGPFHIDGPSDVAVINHYHAQTYEDWQIKVDKGREDGREKKGAFYWNLDHWKNSVKENCEVEDTTARDFMYG